MFRLIPMTARFSFFAVIALALAGCNRVQDVAKGPIPNSDDTIVGETTGDQTVATTLEPADFAEVGPGDTPATDLLPDDQATQDSQDETPVAELTIGDGAPQLEISEWMKGDQVIGFEDGQVYVVEFWATWCGPCRTSMPHISQLQDHFGDQVVFIGISSEDHDTVRTFLDQVQNTETEETWDTVVTYRLALDEGGLTNTAYMNAAGQSGIPAAFIVGRDACIEWIGHPMTMDGVLESVVAGTWDREAARTEFAERKAAEAASKTAINLMRAAQRDGDWTRALEMLDELIAQYPSQTQPKQWKMRALLSAEQFDDAFALGEELGTENWDNAQTLNGIAWMLATEVPKPHQDLDLALRLAERANSLTDQTDGSVLDTLARVYYEQGDLEKAVAWQKKAVEHAPGGPSSIRKALERYEAELKEVDKAEPEADAPQTGEDAAEKQPVADSPQPDESAEEEPEADAPETDEDAGEESPETDTPPSDEDTGEESPETDAPESDEDGPAEQPE